MIKNILPPGKHSANTHSSGSGPGNPSLFPVCRCRRFIFNKLMSFFYPIKFDCPYYYLIFRNDSGFRCLRPVGIAGHRLLQMGRNAKPNFINDAVEQLLSSDDFVTIQTLHQLNNRYVVKLIQKSDSIHRIMHRLRITASMNLSGGFSICRYQRRGKIMVNHFRR